MLSTKMTFSLTILVMLLAIGLIVAPYGIAHEKEVELANGDKIKVNPTHPKATLAVPVHADIGSADGPQVMRPTLAAFDSTDTATGNVAGDTGNISILIDFNTPVSVMTKAGDATAAAADATKFDATDITITAYNKEGIPVMAPSINADGSTTAVASTLMRGNPDNGKNAALVIGADALTHNQWAMVYTLYVVVPEKKFKNTDRGLNAQAAAHADNVTSDVLIIHLVGADDGEAYHYEPPYADTDQAAAGTPRVVSITKTLDASGFTQAAGGAFTVRIILTEEPKAFTADHIVIDGGSATVSAPTMGLPIKMDRLTPAVAGGVALYNTEATADQNTLPQPTGRDDMYHQYMATITPAAGFDGELMISVAQFEDMVLPTPNMYVPLSKSQRLDTTLTGDPLARRTARISDGRELLTVQVHTIADAKVEGAKKAYEARQTVLDANPNAKVLDNKLIIPAGGYLVLAKGKTDSDPISGVQNVSMKTKDKKTAEQKLYNVKYEFGLPFPADDLDNFFRNGGTLNLAYADITAATGSGHDDSKGPTGDDATGYTAATTNAYAAGAVIINEIMWGLDGNSPNGQYIELYNPGTAAIGIDNKEWVLSVGAPPTGFTVIDAVSNNPASGYWQVPGNGGVTKVSAEHPVISDLVSMSRMMGAADGTAAASWAKSMRPSENMIGRRIGTPGAPNSYVKPAEKPAPPPPPPPAKASVAKAGDIKISEIMVASNDGRLPQWIELANVSDNEVSLMGWSIVINNDPMDKDVVGGQVSLDIGDVTVDAGQVVLVVSKMTARNSGVGMGKGDLREDRIVDVQSQVSPGEGTYILISEMGFRMSLVVPPATGGVIETSDVVGNLGMGWDLQKAEGNRSSLIRHEMSGATEIMGTDAAGWLLASGTGLGEAYMPTYYGHSTDEGTPGYDAGGALPVELSKFGAKRDPLTGQVTIAWETQSELNNAGFFIKRSQHKTGQFTVVNPTMIAGAGTTSEKQSYTYTDTTAKPNTVYYYQIEDVSLDGNRQTLTRAHRLKGHVGAAGKATTTWGELKEQK